VTLAEPPLAVYAAGSLHEVLGEIAAGCEAQTGQGVSLTFGASGLLRERIERGEPASVFASADMGHPQRLAEQGGWSAPAVLVRNHLCALTTERVHTTPEQLLDPCLIRPLASAPRPLGPILRAIAPGPCFDRPRRCDQAPVSSCSAKHKS